VITKIRGRRRAPTLLIDHVCVFVGNVVDLVDLTTLRHKYIRSESGCGLGNVAVHPSNKYFAVAEKGTVPNILVFEFPSLRLHRIMRKGTLEAYSHLSFNPRGDLIASVGCSPDYQLTVWDWKKELVVLRTKVRQLPNIVFVSNPLC
jgi:hypothetical protein